MPQFARTNSVLLILLMVGLVVGFVVGCGGGESPSPDSGTGADQGSNAGEVKLAGSSTVYPISTAVAEEYQKQNPEVNLSVSSTGTGGGFQNFFCEGKTDINNASRPIAESELEQCRQNGVEPIEFRVATDALTVVVNNDNDWASCMTVDELAQVWRPDDPAQTWSDVRSGWPDEEMELYGAASTSGTFDYFTEVIVGEENAHRSDYQPTEHDNVIVQAVSGSRYAMGYFGFAYYSQNKNRVNAVAVDSGDGCVKPSLENAQEGRYTPLSRPLFIYVSESSLRNKSQVRDFVRNYLRVSNSELIEQVGYVPVTESIMNRNLDDLSVLLESE